MLKTYLSDRRPIWFDLLHPTSEDVSIVETTTGITLPSREKLSEVENSSRVSESGGALFLSLPFVASVRAIDDDTTPIGFVLAAETLVTLRFAHLRSFDCAVEAFNSTPPTSSADVFALLIGQMVDANADCLEKIGGELDALSNVIFRSTKIRNRVGYSNSALRGTLRDVGNQGERLSRIRESILGLQRIVPYVISLEPKWVDTQTMLSLKSAQADLLSLADYEAQLYGKVQFLLDAVLGFITTKQNDIFQVLTIWSVAGIPPTLIASIYGMNFKNMPELNWALGYPYALVLIAVSAILPLLWFKWRGWF